MRRAAAALVLLLAGCGGVGTGESTEGFVSSNRAITVVPVRERTLAPELAGLDLNGKPLSSKTLRGSGRVLVVNVWGSWCAPCRREAPVLASVARRDAKRGVAFLGLLSRDKPPSALAFVRRFGVTYPSLQDSGGRLQLLFADSLPSQGVPTTWVIDRHGRVAARILGEITRGTLQDLIDDELARR
ncbi:MAG TPA: TlpA disulfide reductase family protein [Aeromicrobium sp.]|nr:TlpA disulfide reductase family protein [Aeromicrobium sp.]